MATVYPGTALYTAIKERPIGNGFYKCDGLIWRKEMDGEGPYFITVDVSPVHNKKQRATAYGN